MSVATTRKKNGKEETTIMHASRKSHSKPLLIEAEDILATGLRRFKLRRNEDESKVSGVGFVAEGVQFSDGTCMIKWVTATSSIGIYHSAVEMIHIHGHGGKTTIEWIDEAPDVIV
jgi:hypothetical protein